jgi:hypothetical protein
MNYLYNGVELPALPERDKTTYPYVSIVLWGVHTGTPEYRAYASTIEQSISYETTAAGYLRQDLTLNQPYLYAKFDDSVPNDWGYNSEQSWYKYEGATISGKVRLMLNGEQQGHVIWSNHDIFDEGNLYHAASDPIPVGGTSEPLDPTSMLMGWLVGRAVASQRGKA